MATEVENELTRYFAWIEEQIGVHLHRDEQGDGDGLLEVDVRSFADRATAGRPRARWWFAAAMIVGGLTLGLLALTVGRAPDSVQTDTVPAPPTPSTTPAPSSNPAVTAPPSTMHTTTPPSAPAVSSVPSIPAPPASGPSLWMELEPGATAPLPAAPIAASFGSAVVWTGTEVIIWGGLADDEPCCTESQDGAAFDPATGTWREIVPPPEGVRGGVVVWTGTEMAVWSDGDPDTVSAAYDPAADTWRSIADPPVPGSAAVSIGDAVVFVGDEFPNGNGSLSGFAYLPATNEWRRLADGPWSSDLVWTGTTIIVVTERSSDTGTSLAGYDPATDRWRVLEGLDGLLEPVVIPGREGGPVTVAMLSGATGTSVQVLDDRGNAIGELAGRPADLVSTCVTPPGDTSCLLSSLHAVAVGGEVLFWYSGDGWALDVSTQTWRSFPLDGRQPAWDGTEVVAVGDVLFAWGADRDGLVYRAATAG